jgi:hypothetical protein
MNLQGKTLLSDLLKILCVCAAATPMNSHADTSPLGCNVALSANGGEARARDYYLRCNDRPALVIDGVVAAEYDQCMGNAIWQANVTPRGEETSWLEVELAAARQINAVTIHWLSSDTFFTSYAVQYSADGTNWQRNFFSVKAPKGFHRDIAISHSG